MYTFNYRNIASNPNKGTLLREVSDDVKIICWEVLIHGPIDKTIIWNTIAEFSSLEKAREYFES